MHGSSHGTRSRPLAHGPVVPGLRACRTLGAMIAPHRPYLASDGPLAFAHRGGSKERPENTMASFAAAVELGYPHLETDTQLTRDGVLLAFHDETLDRVTDLHGPVSDHTLAEVRRADAGYSFSPDGGRPTPSAAGGSPSPPWRRCCPPSRPPGSTSTPSRSGWWPRWPP